MLVTKETIYRCDICGKESGWIKSQWIAILYPLGFHDSRGWEHEFHVCGHDCELILDAMTKKQITKLANKISNQ